MFAGEPPRRGAQERENGPVAKARLPLCSQSSPALPLGNQQSEQPQRMEGVNLCSLGAMWFHANCLAS